MLQQVAAEGTAARPCPHEARCIVEEKTIGIAPGQLTAQLKEGKGLVEKAEAQGMSIEELVAALSGEALAALEAVVADGKLSQEEAAERLEGVQGWPTRVVNDFYAFITESAT